MKKLFVKYRELIVYIVVGVLTTVVSWGACFVAKLFLDPTITFQNNIINTIGWIAGVSFSYPLSRKWVFKSTNPQILKEFIGFAASRLSTWILDIIIMLLFVNVWPFYGLIQKVCGLVSYVPTEEMLETLNYWFVKICISAVLVTVLNYVFSKVLIFGKKNKQKVTEDEETSSEE